MQEKNIKNCILTINMVNQNNLADLLDKYFPTKFPVKMENIEKLLPTQDVIDIVEDIENGIQ